MTELCLASQGFFQVKEARLNWDGLQVQRLGRGLAVALHVEWAGLRDRVPVAVAPQGTVVGQPEVAAELGSGACRARMVARPRGFSASLWGRRCAQRWGRRTQRAEPPRAQRHEHSPPQSALGKFSRAWTGSQQARGTEEKSTKAAARQPWFGEGETQAQGGLQILSRAERTKGNRTFHIQMQL
ncbi:PREDICTED: uncharacterized protein LOC102029185 isoform X2 [Chinchilla lanigera]|uniref:uncharacterized protein LOC102029185 isoform X2 n=1 Tax=Chinchilla lanigera TaxID=34839 RepID=UPI000699096B|nr:PREDICTED: uncharacterized protein LOC102029185 isoform X2 [Chinchilla lanigera]